MKSGRNGNHRTFFKEARMRQILVLLMASLLCVQPACTISKMDALTEAVKTNNVAKTWWLIKTGADVNAKSNNGMTALMIATSDDAVADLIPLLKAAGAE